MRLARIRQDYDEGRYAELGHSQMLLDMHYLIALATAIQNLMTEEGWKALTREAYIIERRQRDTRRANLFAHCGAVDA